MTQALTVYHPDYRTYHFGPDHPFTPMRLTMLFELLEALGVAPEQPVTPAIATREEIRWVHREDFVSQVEAASNGSPKADARQYGLGTSDVPIFAGMDAAARTLVGGTLTAARLVIAGDTKRALQMGGGLHHAQHALAAGFCVYNDLSVAIHALRRAGHRVAYLDVDVHHGDGVQWLHYDDPDVLTISLHETGRFLYPGTGGIDEFGKGAGHGASLNLPLAPYTEDASYLDAFERVVPDALAHFKPDVLLVQCGADAHFRDPLADLMLTTRAYEKLFRRILDLADRYAGGHLVCAAGGGYDLDATIRVWALLYHVMHGLALPDALPDAWLTDWSQRLETPLTPTLHDPPMTFSLPRRAAIEAENRQTTTALLERLAPIWY